MNEGQGKDGGDQTDVLYQQITSSSDEAIKVALSLVDEADEAARKMVREYEEAGAHRMIFLARQPGNEFLADLEQMARKFIVPG